MSIYEMVKSTISEYKQEVQDLQWAVMNAFASILYSEYIANIKQKTTPVQKVLVPEISLIRNLLDEDSELMKTVSEYLVDDLLLCLGEKHFPLLHSDRIECTKCVVDGYILPNVQRYIPETIEKKFGLNDPNQQVIQQDRDLELFAESSKNIYHFYTEILYSFIRDQTVLQLLTLSDSVKKEIVVPERNSDIDITKNEILVIDNDQAICPICVDYDTYIIYWTRFKTLKFVTSTHGFWAENRLHVDTGISNRVKIVDLV